MPTRRISRIFKIFVLISLVIFFVLNVSKFGIFSSTDSQPDSDIYNGLVINNRPNVLPLQRKLSHIPENLGFLPSYFSLVNVGDNKTSDVHCNSTHSKTDPPFPICTYPPSRDKFISNALLSSGVWEPYITKAFQEALRRYPDAIIIDIGSNIGYYTFLAASMGHVVISIEPSSDNIDRLKEGARLGRQSESVYILQNAVSDVHKTVSLSENADNQGGIHIVENIKAGSGSVSTVTLDDLLYLLGTNTAIVKIDIEGYECKAMKTSRKFFSRIRVPYIFMEWQRMYLEQDKPNCPCPKSAIIDLTNRMVELGYHAHEIRTGIEMQPHSSTSNWKIGDVYWRESKEEFLVPPL